MIKKVLLVFLAVVVLVCGLVLPTSAAVASGSNTSANMSFIPFNIQYVFTRTFGEIDKYYQFSVFDSVVQGSFANSRADGINFGSEDYRNAGIGTFVIYPSWDEWCYSVNVPLRYIDSVNYNNVLPELRFTDCVLLDTEDVPPDEYGATFKIVLNIDVVHFDGSTSRVQVLDSEEIEWNERGLFTLVYNSTDYINIDGGSVDARLAALNDEKEIYYISGISASSFITGDEQSDITRDIGYYVYADPDYTSSAGYTLVRTAYNGVYNFDEPFVKWLTPASLLEWLGYALDGVMNVTLFEFAGLSFTPAGLLYMCFGLLGLFAILRFFAGG